MPIPDCECIWGLPLNDKLDAIYCVYYQNAQSTVDLPTCECVKGMPLQDKVSAIFCALLQQGGGGGGNIDPDQINGITPFGISVLTSTPPGSHLLVTDLGGTLDSMAFADFDITAEQISNATLFGLSAITGAPAPDVLLKADGGGLLAGTMGITFSQITDSSSALQAIQAASGGADVATYIAGTSPNSGSASPPNFITVSNGIVTSLS